MSIAMLVLYFVVLILVVGLLYHLVIWACGVAGIPVPTRALQIVCAIIVVLGLIWLIQGAGAVKLPRIGAISGTSVLALQSNETPKSLIHKA